MSVHSSFLDNESSSKVNLQKKADKLFLSGPLWKLWAELQGDFNADNSIAETELELALIKLKLANKKNPRKLLEEMASCKVKYRIPVSDGKKVAQLSHWWKEIWNCDHGNSNVQEERESYVHRETHCG